MKSNSATSSPAAPPRTAPPPPPRLALDDETRLMAKEAESLAPKKMDFRDIMALFHGTDNSDASARDRAWEALWTTTVVEAREDHRLQRALGSRGAGSDDSSRAGKSSGGPEPPKRPRQPSPADNEPNKLNRVNRGPSRPKPSGGGSKLLQKLSARGT